MCTVLREGKKKKEKYIYTYIRSEEKLLVKATPPSKRDEEGLGDERVCVGGRGGYDRR